MIARLHAFGSVYSLNAAAVRLRTRVHSTIYSTHSTTPRWLPSSHYTSRTTSLCYSSPQSDFPPYTTSPRQNSRGSCSGRRVGMLWDRASASGGACFVIFSPFVLVACLHADWEGIPRLPLYFRRQSRVSSLVHALLILPLAARCLHLPTLSADRAFGWDPRVGTLFAVTSG